ncbi:MAG: hypothetical protein PHF21_04560 [Bacilli bacterium]|nr:hypothetical protein [Bacilli bacterium]
MADFFDNENEPSIVASSGEMDFYYNGGPLITISDIAPSNDPFITKTFTINANNTTDEEMLYQINLEIIDNSFEQNSISYTLKGTNLDNKGILSTDVLTKEGIGKEDVNLGIGKFIGKVTNAAHSYEIKFYFYRDNYNQLDDLGKIFKANINIESKK